ncbi:hypothetical protein SEA_HUWBERT_56 [Microbacterium phage Huwbert]|nr:hypothetical protein SEA_HUWBERT_56 [Microbacterium phage Huwbert]
MKKTADEELSSTTITLINPCPRCGGVMRCSILVGLGIVRPQHQFCLSQGCGHFNSLIKEKHAK